MVIESRLKYAVFEIKDRLVDNVWNCDSCNSTIIINVNVMKYSFHLEANIHSAGQETLSTELTKV
jgi:hypothetical protein